jgi:hypothetical protein
LATSIADIATAKVALEKALTRVAAFMDELIANVARLTPANAAAASEAAERNAAL